MQIMRRSATSFLAVLCAFVVAGCGEQTDARVGHWTLDFETIVEQAEQRDGEPIPEFALAMMKKMQYQIETREDGAFIAIAKRPGREDRVEGTWTATDAGMVISNVTTNGEPAPDGKGAVITLIDRDHFMLRSDGDDDELYFVRISIAAE